MSKGSRLFLLMPALRLLLDATVGRRYKNMLGTGKQ
jgi:hypothetical protein